MNTIAVDRALFQSCLMRFLWFRFARGETHTPSGESSAHSRASQPKVGKSKVRNVLLRNGERVLEATDRAGRHGLILAEELLGVFDEADDDDDGGAGHADKEHDLEDVHCEQPNLEHDNYCSCDCETFPFEGSFWSSRERTVAQPNCGASCCCSSG